MKVRTAAHSGQSFLLVWYLVWYLVRYLVRLERSGIAQLSIFPFWTITVSKDLVGLKIPSKRQRTPSYAQTFVIVSYLQRLD